MPIETIDVIDIPALVSAAMKVADGLPTGHFLWYRGHGSLRYQLLPKIMRDGKAIEDVFEREKRLQTRFRQRSLAYWPAGYPQNEWEHLFAMQHYGMPTRLLDWSENLLVAAHFALGRVPSDPAEPETPTPSVWCIDPIAWNRSTVRLAYLGDAIHVLATTNEELESYLPSSTRRRSGSPIAMFGTHNSGRIVAQKGTFIIWGNDPRPLEEHVTPTGPVIWQIRLTADRDKLLRQLLHLGVTETMVFPELAALGEELSRTEGWK